MVSSESLAGIDVVIFGFALVPILFFGISGETGMMFLIMIVLVGLRLAIQFALRDRVIAARKVSPRLRLDSWSYNAMFLSVGGALAIVFGFDGGLVSTIIIAIPVLVLWRVIHYILYGERREKYDPYTQDIGGDENNGVM